MKIISVIIILFLCSCCSNRHSIKSNLQGESYDSVYTIEREISASYETAVETAVDTVMMSRDVVHANVKNFEDSKSQYTIKNVSKKIQKSILNKPDISIGQVVYKVPDTMIIFTNYRITVRISKDTSIENIVTTLTGNLRRAEIPVSSEMEVSLVDESPEDDKSFKVTKVNSDQQSIEEDYSEWIFNVQPIKTGNKKLNLVVSIIRGNSKKQVVYTDVIHVRSNVKKEVKSFWDKYWQYILSTFVIPLSVYFWQKKKKSKKGI